MIRCRGLAVWAAAFLFLAAMNWWAGEKRFLELKDPSGGGATAEAVIEPMETRRADFMNLSFTAFGLKPGAVYSVWYTNDKGERMAAGVDRGHFKTGPDGKGRFVTSVFEHELSGWRYLDVMHHPDGDEKNTAGMTLVLRGDMVYGTHP